MNSIVRVINMTRNIKFSTFFKKHRKAFSATCDAMGDSKYITTCLVKPGYLVTLNDIIVTTIWIISPHEDNGYQGSFSAGDPSGGAWDIEQRGTDCSGPWNVYKKLPN
jgi:hypothetical protein